jgi:hypothetical protein
MRTTGIVAGLILAVVAVWVKAHTPDDYDRRYAPLTSTGHIGSPVGTGLFEVKVEKVGAARSAVSRLGDVVRPGGVFVIVTASARSRRRSLSLSTALLRTRDGREFAESAKEVTARADEELHSVKLGPEVWRRGVFVFEIPPTALAGAAIEVSDRAPEDNDPPQGFPAFGFELTAQANIALGIDAGQARRIVADAPDRATVHPDAP